MINDILDFSKIEAGKLQLDDSGFDLRETVEDVVELLAENAHRKGARADARSRSGQATSPTAATPTACVRC